MNSNVSVVIPTFCSAQYVRETLGSIVAQTISPTEIIVVDDCSPDDTCAIVEQLQTECPLELRLLRMPQNSGGPVGPMNAGVAAARSEFVAMLDHDDLMVPDRIACTLPLLQSRESTGIVFGQSQGMNAAGERMIPRPQAYQRFGAAQKIFDADSAFNSLLAEGYGYGGAGGMLFRKSAWEAVAGFDVSYKICWDYEFALKTTLGGWAVGYVPEIVYLHRLHSNNLEGRDGGAALYREISVLLNRLCDNSQISTRQQALIKRNLANRAILAAQQQRERNDYHLAQQFYREAWKTGAAPFRSLRGMMKNTWMAWTQRR